MAQGRQTSRRDRLPIEATLTADGTYRLGDPITVTFALRNSGNTAYQVLKWGTPLEGEVTNFLRVTRDGEPVPYDGRMVKRGDPTEASYVVIAPGATIARTVDISRSYPIDVPGEYTATVRATIQDAFAVQGNAKQLPRLRRDHVPHELPSASVQFKVVPDGEARKTVGAEARQAEAQRNDGGALAKGGAMAKAKAPGFSGGTSQEQADTVIAHNNAEYFTSLAVQQLQSTTPSSSNTLYQDWFGAFDQGRYDSVTGHYGDINNVLNTESTTYDLTGSDCDPDVFAWTNKGSRTVHLCSLYLSAPQIGTDCKFGTLVHEWSHAVSSTDDYAYGETNAGNLASSDPGKAIDNADNHEYFTEHLAQSDFGKTLTYITDRGQFGKDEIDALLVTTSPAIIEKAFYVHADGFWPDKLGISSASLGTSANVKPTLSMNPSIGGMTVEVAALQAEDTSLPMAPQRFTWVLRAKFANSSGFPNVPNGEKFVTLTATLAGETASAQIRLLKEASPYELDGATSWLSTDVRVFQIAANQNRFGAACGDSPAGASAFIKQAIANLNSGSTTDTFDGISTDQQTSALELSQAVNGTNIYNFAVAKVRYVGTTSISNVRVFFRLFPVSSTSTEFAVNSTYRRSTQGTTTVPLLGVSGGGDLLTIPCFAEPRVDSASTPLTGQADAANVRATMAASPPNGETVAYFGAWLDINQTAAQFPSKPSPADGPWGSGRKSIQTLIKNAHQCLVAEIAYDGDPIKDGASPGGSDKLAQRNLAIVASANPGDLASHRIPNVFELWPAAAIAGAPAPDELLIDWGNVPDGSTATIFIPEVTSSQIVALAAGPGRGSSVRAVDGQTIAVPTGGISYIPLPPGAAFGLTGLLTVDLPETVKKGEVYGIVIRQVTDAIPAPAAPPPDVIRKAGRRTAEIVVSRPPLRWRRIVGSYQITIPVRTKEVMLPPESRLLSVLRWNLESMSTDERWYPVFSRYVELIADRVRALGGDPDEVHGSPAGEPGRRGDEGGGDGRDQGRPCAPIDDGPTCRYDGKVTGVVYDCFGDFEGFILDDCGREVRFLAREHEIEHLVRLAWRERIAITVMVRVAAKRRPISIILRHAPEPVLTR